MQNPMQKGCCAKTIQREQPNFIESMGISKEQQCNMTKVVGYVRFINYSFDYFT